MTQCAKLSHCYACKIFYGVKNGGMDKNSNDNTELGMDYELEWIYVRYGNGDNVADIAKQLKKSESYVYASMKRLPEKYEDVKTIREEKHDVRIRRVRGLADKIVLDYLEDIGSDKEKASGAIDKVSRIAREYAHRVQLAEGKSTENYGVNGKDGLPFEVIIMKTYETPDGEAAPPEHDEIEEVIGE